MKTNLSSKIAIVALLASCLVGWSAKAADGGTLWASNCASCHGKDGKGQTMMGRKLAIKDLTDPKVQSSLSDADATKTIKQGDDSKKMKGFADKLSDDDVKALVAYIRSLK